MVDGDDGHGWVALTEHQKGNLIISGSKDMKKRNVPDIRNGDRRFRERSVDVVDRNRVVRVRRIATDVDHDPQLARLASSSDRLGGDERGDLGREVDAVDEDVDVEDLLEGTTLSGLRHIPLHDVIPATQTRRNV